MIGGAGFLGQHIVSRLLKDGWVVRVFDIVPKWPGEDGPVEYTKGDLCKDEVRFNLKSLFHIDSLNKTMGSFYIEVH